MASAGTFGLSVRADNFTGRVWSVLGLVVCVGLLTFGRPKADKQTAPTSRSQVVLIGVSLSIVCAAIGVIAIVFAARAPSVATPYGTSSKDLSEDIVYISGVGLLVCAAVTLLVTGWRAVTTDSPQEALEYAAEEPDDLAEPQEDSLPSAPAPAVSSETIDLLADRPHLIDEVGTMRWKEWGQPPEPTDPQWWIDATRSEAGRDGLPVTYVALNSDGELLGAIGLGAHDIAERQDRSPWILGLVVRTDRRGDGIGRRLLQQTEQHAAALGYPTIWVANEGQAAGFYSACGYSFIEVVRPGESGAITYVFSRSL
jgi:GNAT superfamily N-acetyltransferase